MDVEAAVRDLLSKLLEWQEAHVGFDAAIAGIASDMRSKQPSGLPYSPWQLLEHVRRTQHDIPDFCVNPNYHELNWPADYWPPSPAPTSAAAWDESTEAFHRDRHQIQVLEANHTIDLPA